MSSSADMNKNDHGCRLTANRLQAMPYTSASSRIKDKKDDPINASRLERKHTGPYGSCPHCGSKGEAEVTVDDLDAWMDVLTKGANDKETLKLMKEAGAVDTRGR